EKEKICKIIRRHGKYEKFEEFDDEEYIFLEADNLGGIDFERVTPTFNKKDLIKYIEIIAKKTRGSRFKTETGKKYLKEVVRKAKEYARKMPE
ncbi:MAG: hypothetical protein ABH821_04660, partial [archaeon]